MFVVLWSTATGDDNAACVYISSCLACATPASQRVGGCFCVALYMMLHSACRYAFLYAETHTCRNKHKLTLSRLQIHLMGLGTASSFLARVLQPPPQKSVAAAVATLREVCPLSKYQKLKPVGSIC
jgi:hypothetical protein